MGNKLYNKYLFILREPCIAASMVVISLLILGPAVLDSFSSIMNSSLNI